MDITQSQQIAARIREMRSIMELSVEEIAAKLHISKETYEDYEADRVAVPISTLNELAEIFHTDITVLLTGESPRMAEYTLVRKGQGVNVKRYEGYSYQTLAYNFKGRTMEPMLVYLTPREDEGKEPALVSHGGQEFNLVVEGTVKVVLGKKEFLLNEGDSIYFDPSIPHGQRAVGGPVKFVTIINN